MLKAIKDGGLWKGIDCVIEQPIFVESHPNNLIQLADMIAYVIHGYYKGDSNLKEFFEMSKSKMYRVDGKPDSFGLKEFPWMCGSGGRCAQLRRNCLPKATRL